MGPNKSIKQNRAFRQVVVRLISTLVEDKLPLHQRKCITHFLWLEFELPDESPYEEETGKSEKQQPPMKGRKTYHPAAGRGRMIGTVYVIDFQFPLRRENQALLQKFISEDVGIR